MGSFLEQNEPLKPKTGTGNDRDTTIAHLLAASGYASAPADKVAAVVFSPALASNVDYFFKSTIDSPSSNVTPLRATESVRAAESVSIGTAPPLIRSDITANLLSPEPKPIKAYVAPEDPTYRNLTQTDVPPPRPVTAQPEVAVTRMLKEGAAVAVAKPTPETSAGALAPVARLDTPVRQEAPQVVAQTPPKVVEQPIRPVTGTDNFSGSGLSPATMFATGRNDAPVNVAPMPRATNDGPAVATPQTRNGDGSPIAPVAQVVRNADGSPVAPTAQVVRNADGSPVAPTAQVTRNDVGSPVAPTAQVTRNDVGSPVAPVALVARNDVGSPIAPVAPFVRNGDGSPVAPATPIRNGDGNPVQPPGTLSNTRNNSDAPLVPSTPVRNDGTPIRNEGLGAAIGVAAQNRNDGTPINTSPARGDIPAIVPTPTSTRVETLSAPTRDAPPLKDAPQPAPSATPHSSIVTLAQSGNILPDTVRVAADRLSKDNYVPPPVSAPTYQPSDRQSPLPSNVVPAAATDRGQPLPAVQRADAPTITTSDGVPRATVVTPTTDRPGAPLTTPENRTSDASRPASPLPGAVSERPSASGLPDAPSRPNTSIDPVTGKISTVPGTDNNVRPAVDNNNNARPGVDPLRGVDNNARPTTDTTRPVVDTAPRPGVLDPTKQDLLPRTASDGRLPDGRTPDAPRTTPDGRVPDGRTQDVPRTTPDGRLPDGRTQDVPRTTPDGRLPDGRTQDVPRTTPDGRLPDGRTQDVPKTTPDGRPVDGVKPISDSRQQDAPRIGADGRPVEPVRTGPDGRPVENSRTDGRPVENPRTGTDGRPQDGKVAPDGRTQDAPKADFRQQDATKSSPEGRPQDGQKPASEGRLQDSPRVNTTDGTTKVEPNRTANQDGITRPTEQKNVEAPKGELGRSGANEGRTTDSGRTVQDGAIKNPDGSNLRAQEQPGRQNDGLNTRAIEQSGRNQEGVRNAEQNISSKSIDGTQIRNPEAASTMRSENQSGKLDVRPDSASNRTAPESNPQSTSTRPGEGRAENVSNRTGEQRTENVANRTGEARPENVANRTGEARSENAANRTGESRPENVANRTGEPRPENVANRTGEPRLDNTNKPGEGRTDSAVTNKNIENITARTNEPSKATEISGTRPGEVRNDLAANRLNEIPSVKNSEAANVRGDVQANRPTDVASNKVDGVTNRGNDIPNTRSTDANSDAKPMDNSVRQTNSSNVRVDGANLPDGGDVVKPSDRVGLNNDSSRLPQIEVPLNLVATQKEAAAIKQVLNELKQNQNLSPSEVLELPSFKEALRLLDALKPKDGEVSSDGKQHFSTSFVEAMRLSDFLKVLEKANEVEQKRLHKQQWAARSLAQNQHRVRYLVQKDETLESIAEKILGDIRFVQLLVTINRAEIIFTCVSGKSVSTVYEGQYLWIPTPNEVAIHRKHYFNANSAATRGEPLAPEAETPIMVEEYEAPTTVRDFATRLRSVTAPPVGAHSESANNPNSPMAVVLYRLRFAGNRNSVNLDEVVETAAENRRRYKVRLGETLQSIAVNDELMKDVNMWVLICRVNDLDTAVDVVGRPRVQLNRGDIIDLPNQADIEEFKLLARLMEIAELSGKKIDIDLTRRPSPSKTSQQSPQSEQSQQTPQCKIDRKMSIETLAERCRMILTDNDDTSYSIKLQRDTLEGKWITVASYESKGGKTLRWTYRIDGTKNCLEVGLPAAVSREMAIEDFQRNWRFYYNRYTNIKTDTLELLDMSEAANR